MSAVHGPFRYDDRSVDDPRYVICMVLSIWIGTLHGVGWDAA